jgi:hypothetical protein
MNMSQSAAASAGNQETGVPTFSDAVLEGPSTTRRTVETSRPTRHKPAISFKGWWFLLLLLPALTVVLIVALGLFGIAVRMFSN